MFGGYDIALWVLLAVATATDLKWGKIPNALTLPSIALALAVRAYAGGLTDFTASLTCVAIAFALFFPLYVIKAFAAGDVKLLMALGAWSSTKYVIEVGVLAILIGALVGLVVLVQKKGFSLGVKSVAAHLKDKNAPGATRMPFAPAFLCGMFLIKIAEMKQWHWL